MFYLKKGSLLNQNANYRVSQKKFTRLAGNGMKSMWSIFKTKMLIYQSKANSDCKGFVLESRISCSILVRDLCGIDFYIVTFGILVSIASES